MNITLFGAENEVSENYKRSAEQLAQLIAKSGHVLFWGGVDAGLMKVMTDTIQAAGGKVVGVGADYLKDKLHKSAEMIMAKDMNDRNRVLLEKGDAILALPGGTGTINEITYVLRLAKHGFQKPVVVLNILNFFEGLRLQLTRMSDEGFLKRSLEEMVHFASTPEDAMKYINAHGS